jgi:hypothetical protein
MLNRESKRFVHSDGFYTRLRTARHSKLIGMSTEKNAAHKLHSSYKERSFLNERLTDGWLELFVIS